MATQHQDPQRVVTGNVRLSYVHLFKPYKNPKNINATEKYSVTILIPKTDTATMQRINAAIEAAAQWATQNKWNGARPPQLSVPIHDGDGLRQSGEPFPEECKGHWVMTASSDIKPEIVDVGLNPIIDQTQVYSGMYAKVSVRFFGYLNSGKKGIGAALGNVQKIADGEPLSISNVSAEQDFGADAAPWAGQQQGYQQPVYTPPTQPVHQQAYQPSIRQPAYQQPVYAPPTQPAPQQVYQQQPVYQAPAPTAAINPITGQPIGGIKGLGQ